jgi:hypothetical protein
VSALGKDDVPMIRKMEEIANQVCQLVSLVCGSMDSMC